MQKLISLCLSLSLILLACNQKVKAPGDEKSPGQFTFAYLTDIHLQPELNAVEGFRMAIDTINKINPDFVLTGGDLIMDALNQTYGRSDSLYNLYNQLSEEFNMPVYNTVGNHEIFGWHSDKDEIQDNPEFGKKMYENRIGNRYYSFDHKGWHFIVLDAMARGKDGRYIGKVDDKQVGWLKQDLRNIDKETPIAVSVHIPFITSQTQLNQGSLAANSESTVISNARDLLLIFRDYNLKLVLQGHLHFLEDLHVENQVHFITGGAVSGYWLANSPGSRQEEGFLLVRVSGEEIEWEYVDYGWIPEPELESSWK